MPTFRAARACGRSARRGTRPVTNGRWRRARCTAGTGYIDLQFADATATLVSPPDQVLRAGNLATLYLGLRDSEALATVQVFARVDPTAPWQEIVAQTDAASLARTAPGLAVPLTWPVDWRARGEIADSMQIVLRFRPGTDHARIDRIALYPRANSPPEARLRPQ